MAADLFSTLLYSLERKRAQREAQAAMSQQAAVNTADAAMQMAGREIDERNRREQQAIQAGELAGRSGQAAPITEDPRFQELVQMGTNAARAALEEQNRAAREAELQRLFRSGEADKDRDLQLALANMAWWNRGDIAAGQNAARVAAAGRRSAGAGLDPTMVNYEKTARVLQNQISSRLKQLNLNPMTRWDAVDDPEIQRLGTELQRVSVAMMKQANVPAPPLSSQPAPAEEPIDPGEEAMIRVLKERGHF